MKQQTWPELPETIDNLILSADNGYSASLVFLTHSGTIHYIESYPNDAKRLMQLLLHFKPEYAAIEEVFMAPGFKGVASSNFIIMGRYMQAFEQLDIPYETVRAVTWRKVLGIKAKGRDAQKAAAIAYAQQHFSPEDFQKLHSTYKKIIDHHKVPITEPDNNKCESALIGLYALKSKFNIDVQPYESPAELIDTLNIYNDRRLTD